MAGGIYIASKTKHADKWKAYRTAGFPIISTWIDEAGPDESDSLTGLWLRCVTEATNAAVLVAYREKDEILKGAMIEIGCALSQPRLVLLAGDWEGFTFVNHPAVKNVENINTAFSIAMKASYKVAGQSSTILMPPRNIQ